MRTHPLCRLVRAPSLGANTPRTRRPVYLRVQPDACSARLEERLSRSDFGASPKHTQHVQHVWIWIHIFKQSHSVVYAVRRPSHIRPTQNTRLSFCARWRLIVGGGCCCRCCAVASLLRWCSSSDFLYIHIGTHVIHRSPQRTHTSSPKRFVFESSPSRTRSVNVSRLTWSILLPSCRRWCALIPLYRPCLASHSVES